MTPNPRFSARRRQSRERGEDPGAKFNGCAVPSVKKCKQHHVKSNTKKMSFRDFQPPVPCCECQLRQCHCILPDLPHFDDWRQFLPTSNNLLCREPRHPFRNQIQKSEHPKSSSQLSEQVSFATTLLTIGDKPPHIKESMASVRPGIHFPNKSRILNAKTSPIQLCEQVSRLPSNSGDFQNIENV